MNIKELKEVLDEYPEDLDVKMLIPLVDDWADFKLEKCTMKRIRPEIRVLVRNRQSEDLRENHGLDRPKITIDDLKPQEWELCDGMFDFDDEDFHETYETKRALLISNKSRGKSTFDRNGEIEY